MSVGVFHGPMRQVTVRLEHDPAALHPVERRLAEAPDLTRQAMHAVEELPDGSIVLLTEVEGDLDRYREIMADSPAVREFAVSGDESGFCYSHVESSRQVDRLLSAQREAEFVIEMPVEYTADGAQVITMVGREDDFAGGAMDLPDGVEMELVSMGPYSPEAERVFGDLTDRQREVLEAALRLGYYENPREATQADVAAELGVEPGTVGKHLRAVESRVFAKYVR
jgi:DNA-binding NarL/FixJ family response regulator